MNETPSVGFGAVMIWPCGDAECLFHLQMLARSASRQRQAERARSRTCTRTGPLDRDDVPSSVAVGQTTVSNCAVSASGMKRVREA